MVKQFYLIHKQNPIMLLALRTRVDLGKMSLKGYSAFPKPPTL